MDDRFKAEWSDDVRIGITPAGREARLGGEGRRSRIYGVTAAGRAALAAAAEAVADPVGSTGARLAAAGGGRR